MVVAVIMHDNAILLRIALSLLTLLGDIVSDLMRRVNCGGYGKSMCVRLSQLFD